jgi:membrane-associated phospholipid phosphatase
MDSPNFSNSWRTDLVSRIRANFWLKFFGVPAFIAVFFVTYFLLLRFPVFDVTLMPVTALDLAIPYQPAALVVYFSLWLYVSIAPTLLRNREELLTHGKIAAVMGLVGLGIFFFWPTAVPLGPGLINADAALSWLKQVDAAGNACPSLHVAFAVYSGIWLHRVLVEMQLPLAVRLLNGVWCLGIAYSTLATKQHVIVDVMAGGLLGLIAGTIRWRLPVEGSVSGALVE